MWDGTGRLYPYSQLHGLPAYSTWLLIGQIAKGECPLSSTATVTIIPLLGHVPVLLCFWGSLPEKMSGPQGFMSPLFGWVIILTPQTIHGGAVAVSLFPSWGNKVSENSYLRWHSHLHGVTPDLLDLLCLMTFLVFCSFVVYFIFPHLFCVFRSHITQADLKLAIKSEDNLELLMLLPSHPKCWDYK